MAGSYLHAVDSQGRLLHSTNMGSATENGGDAYETIEEMYGMIWWLADVASRGSRIGDRPSRLVALARDEYRTGIARSPGLQQEGEEEEDDDDGE